jgi:hypothetical protein
MIERLRESLKTVTAAIARQRREQEAAEKEWET